MYLYTYCVYISYGTQKSVNYRIYRYMRNALYLAIRHGNPAEHL